jgi:formylglycine-generating enzyme required for sulfatase activity
VLSERQQLSVQRILASDAAHAEGQALRLDIQQRRDVRNLPTTATVFSVWGSTPPPPATVELAPIGNGTKVNSRDGLTYVWIPPGTYNMGASDGEIKWFSDEEPAHEVTLTKGFWMGQTPVTQGEVPKGNGQQSEPLSKDQDCQSKT